MFNIEEIKKYGDVILNSSFKKLTTLRIGGNISYLVKPNNINDVVGLVKYLKLTKMPYMVLGKGSNTLASDNDYKGVVISLAKLNDCRFEDHVVYCEAGFSAVRLSILAMKNNYSGVEFINGIPGSIGGLVFMNAGAYKKEMKDAIIDVLILKDDELVWMKSEELEYGYRSSIFKKHRDWIILATRLKLSDGNGEEIKMIMDKRRDYRSQTQPLSMPSCGSCFRNPEGNFSWKLIDAIGYRGHKLNDIQVSDKHCNFIVNCGDGKAEDFLTIIDEIKNKIKDEYDIDMKLEVEVFKW